VTLVVRAICRPLRGEEVGVSFFHVYRHNGNARSQEAHLARIPLNGKRRAGGKNGVNHVQVRGKV
jgi:hypothetical protein